MPDASGKSEGPNSPVYLEEGISPEVVAKLQSTQNCYFGMHIGSDDIHRDGTRRQVDHWFLSLNGGTRPSHSEDQ
jgi:hypothetical protein